MRDKYLVTYRNGIERIVMLLYQLGDIRMFFENDKENARDNSSIYKLEFIIEIFRNDKKKAFKIFERFLFLRFLNHFLLCCNLRNQ